jgi:hypothetical protein
MYYDLCFRAGVSEYIDKDDWTQDSGFAMEQHLLYSDFLPEWNYLIVASNRAVEIKIFKVDDESTVKIEPDTEDECFILLDGVPFRFPAGLAISRNCPDPTALVVTSHGELVACDFKNTADDAQPVVVKPLEVIPTATQSRDKAPCVPESDGSGGLSFGNASQSKVSASPFKTSAPAFGKTSGLGATGAGFGVKTPEGGLFGSKPALAGNSGDVTAKPSFGFGNAQGSSLFGSKTTSTESKPTTGTPVKPMTSLFGAKSDSSTKPTFGSGLQTAPDVHEGPWSVWSPEDYHYHSCCWRFRSAPDVHEGPWSVWSSEDYHYHSCCWRFRSAPDVYEGPWRVWSPEAYHYHSCCWRFRSAPDVHEGPWSVWSPEAYHYHSCCWRFRSAPDVHEGPWCFWSPEDYHYHSCGK